MKKKKSTDPEKIKQRPGKIFLNNLAMVRAVAKFIPEYPFFMILEGIIWGLINAANVIFMVRLFNQLDDPNIKFGGIALTIGMLALGYLVGYLFDAWYWEYYNTTLFQKLQYAMQRDLYERTLSLDLESYDDPTFYNDYVFAMDQARNKAWEVTENLGKMINRMIASISVLTVMATVSIPIALLIFAFAVCSFLLQGKFNKIYYQKDIDERPMHRRNQYVNRQYHLSDVAKELRTSHVGENLTAMYDQNVDDLVDLRVKFGKKYFGWHTLSNVFYGICPLLILLVGLICLVQGKMALGGFAATITALWRVNWTLGDLIKRFQKFPESSLYIEKYLKFLSTEPKIKGGDRQPGDFESLTFKDVSFSYPFGDAGIVISHLNMTVKKGERIAIVGYNGAGKTTLTKLIMRLYDPTEGEILWNGVNIKEFDLAAYRDKIGTVFQDFKLFAASIAENVLNGPYDGSFAAKERVERALRLATFTSELEKLPEGIDTHLTKEFRDDGTNLSGGESQKIAIARIFAYDYPMIIMDEPSSALDPMAEYQLNHSILDGASDDGRTVIFISHRLSTTRMADRIYMFAGGELIESGSHDELMANSGKYAEMFNLQASKYRAQ